MLDLWISNGFCFLGMAQHEYETKNLECRDIKVFDASYNFKCFYYMTNEYEYNLTQIVSFPK